MDADEHGPENQKGKSVFTCVHLWLILVLA